MPQRAAKGAARSKRARRRRSSPTRRTVSRTRPRTWPTSSARPERGPHAAQNRTGAQAPVLCLVGLTSGQLHDRDHHPDHDEDDDRDLHHDPGAGHYSIMALRNAMATAWTRLSASSLLMARLVSDFTVSALRPMRRATSSV